MTSRMTPLGGVHDDERMLDQLASRSYAGDDRLGVALNAWGKRVDAEADAAAQRADLAELVRRHTAPGLAEPVEAAETTTIRIRASRLLATLGGIGVAATAIGIALAGGVEVPGLQPPSTTSISFDQQQLLTQASGIKQAALTGRMPKAVAIEKLAELADKATNPAVRDQLDGVKAEVDQAKVAPSVSRPAPSPTDLPTVTLPVPSVMPTPAPHTTPAAPEQVTTTHDGKPATKESTKSVPSAGGIPADATSTPVPTPSPSPSSPSSSSGSDDTSSSSSRTSSKPPPKPASRTMPSRPRRTASARPTSHAAGSASAPVATVTDGLASEGLDAPDDAPGASSS